MRNIIDYLSLALAILCAIIGFITENYTSFIGWSCCSLWIIRCKVVENEK